MSRVVSLYQACAKALLKSACPSSVAHDSTISRNAASRVSDTSLVSIMMSCFPPCGPGTTGDVPFTTFHWYLPPGPTLAAHECWTRLRKYWLSQGVAATDERNGLGVVHRHALER